MDVLNKREAIVKLLALHESYRQEQEVEATESARHRWIKLILVHGAEAPRLVAAAEGIEPNGSGLSFIKRS